MTNKNPHAKRTNNLHASQLSKTNCGQSHAKEAIHDSKTEEKSTEFRHESLLEAQTMRVLKETTHLDVRLQTTPKQHRNDKPLPFTVYEST
jgi:hypothetical protein